MVEFTAVLGCADENCKCHTDHICGGELCIVCGYKKRIKTKEIRNPRLCEQWFGSEQCSDQKIENSIFCKFHSDNLPF